MLFLIYEIETLTDNINNVRQHGTGNVQNIVGFVEARNIKQVVEKLKLINITNKLNWKYGPEKANIYSLKCFAQKPVYIKKYGATKVLNSLYKKIQPPNLLMITQLKKLN